MVYVNSEGKDWIWRLQRISIGVVTILWQEGLIQDAQAVQNNP